jgi:sugar/nucleoside kinase (ribokinase family)
VRAVVTIGAAGAVALAGGRFYHARTQRVDVVSTVGSGDSFAARLLLGLERGEELGAAFDGGGGRRLGQRRLAPHRPSSTLDEVARLAKPAPRSRSPAS